MQSRHILTDGDLPLEQLSTVQPISYEEYLRRRGYTALQRAIHTLGPSEVLEMIKRSGLRGRGGAGFPTGKKWEMVVQRKADRKYLCCNAAEDEPGTFKDRYLLRFNPHQLIEGAILAAFAIGAAEVYLYINGRYEEEIEFMEQALQTAKEKGHWENRLREPLFP
ncbi:MAG: hypothetical protein MPW14_16560 [Candidatus Manganitrophus sp.]|nr:MAG: hypothetical protein MPW14_16560 [Candidatus Manganitrophus sp.]